MYSMYFLEKSPMNSLNWLVLMLKICWNPLEGSELPLCCSSHPQRSLTYFLGIQTWILSCVWGGWCAVCLTTQHTRPFPKQALPLHFHCAFGFNAPRGDVRRDQRRVVGGRRSGRRRGVDEVPGAAVGRDRLALGLVGTRVAG
jgi:hypothetical protein